MSNDISDFDPKEAKKYLEIISSQKTFIKPNILYSEKDIFDMVQLRKKFNKNNFYQIVESFVGRRDLSYEEKLFFIQIRCGRCLRLSQKSLIKDDFLDFIKDKQNGNSTNFVCDYCKEIINKQEEIKEVEEKQNKISNQEFINTYLNPACSWNKDLKLYLRIEALKEYCFKTEIIQYLKNLSYKDFLQTPYWKAISDYKKYKQDYTCELCSKQTYKNNLHVHHPNYDIKGEELKNENFKKLKVLCSICHEKIHDIIKD